MYSDLKFLNFDFTLIGRMSGEVRGRLLGFPEPVFRRVLRSSSERISP